MKDKLLKTIMGLSLFVAGSLFAVDGFSGFYPPVDNEASVVSKMNDKLDIKANTTSEIADDMDSFTSFYPPVDDEASVMAIVDDTIDFDNLPATASGGDIGGHGIKSDHMDTYKGFYPLEDLDNGQY